MRIRFHHTHAELLSYWRGMRRLLVEDNYPTYIPGRGEHEGFTSYWSDNGDEKNRAVEVVIYDSELDRMIEARDKRRARTAA